MTRLSETQKAVLEALQAGERITIGSKNSTHVGGGVRVTNRTMEALQKRGLVCVVHHSSECFVLRGGRTVRHSNTRWALVD